MSFWKRWRPGRMVRTGWFVGVVAVILILFAGSWGLLLVWELGKRADAEQVANDVRRHPAVVEHIGDIRSCELDFNASLDEAGERVRVYVLEGSRGKGVLRAECVTVDGSREKVISGSLRLPSGKTVDLFPREDDGGSAR